MSLWHNLRIRLHRVHINIRATLWTTDPERRQVHNGLVAIETLRDTQSLH
jgi:hypothetical protein